MKRSMPPFAELISVEYIEGFALAVLPDEMLDAEVIQLWSLPAKECYWPRSRAEFIERAAQLAARGQDVYVGLSTRKTGLGRYERGDETTCRRALAIGLDLDVGNVGRKPGHRSPDTQAEALDALAALPLAPSLTVSSGYGVHAWYLYAEPVDLFDAETLKTARGCAAGWNSVMKAEFARRGWSYVSMGDLARVLRVPGTLNFKAKGDPRAVALLEPASARRYNLGDFELYAAEVVASYRAGLNGLVLAPDAAPPAMKMAALVQNYPRFAATLAHQRRDLKDQSMSGYDLALADAAVRAGWSDQEIVDLLIYHRRERGEDLKLRESYYALTVSAARQPAGGDGVSAREAAVTHEVEEVAAIQDPDTQRTEVKRLLSKFTGLDVVRIVFHGRDPAKYRVILSSGESFIMESTRDLMRYENWQCRSFEFQAKVPVYPPSKTNWSKLVSYLAQFTELEPEQSALSTLLDEYAAHAVELADEGSDQKGPLVSSGRPLVFPGGRFGFHLGSFRRWCAENGHHVDFAGLQARLRGMGFAATTVSFALGGRVSSRSYWIAGPARRSGEPEKSRAAGEPVPVAGAASRERERLAN